MLLYFKVNYIKALDKYLIGCFMFVFSVLAEYSVILTINGKMKKRKQKQEEVNSNKVQIPKQGQLNRKFFMIV